MNDTGLFLMLSVAFPGGAAWIRPTEEKPEDAAWIPYLRVEKTTASPVNQIWRKKPESHGIV